MDFTTELIDEIQNFLDLLKRKFIISDSDIAKIRTQIQDDLKKGIKLNLTKYEQMALNFSLKTQTPYAGSDR